MSDLFFRFFMATILFFFILFAFRFLGENPESFPRSENIRKEEIEAVVFTVITLGYFSLYFFILRPLSYFIYIQPLTNTIILF